MHIWLAMQRMWRCCGAARRAGDCSHACYSDSCHMIVCKCRRCTWSPCTHLPRSYAQRYAIVAACGHAGLWCVLAAQLGCMQVGALAKRNCSKCYHTLELKYSSATFTSCKPVDTAATHGDSHASAGRKLRPSVGARRNARADAMQQAVAKLQPGEPLPHAGACRHYRHSHRWLRFPCCGYRFPCALSWTLQYGVTTFVVYPDMNE